MLKIKKTLAAIFCISIIFLGIKMTVSAEIIDFPIGTYIQMGKYNNEPILWRYMSDDENGKLIVSDKIICFKAFDASVKDANADGHLVYGTSKWKESNIRTWLNSYANEGEIVWPGNNPPTSKKIHGNNNAVKYEEGKYPYADEKGFLHCDNFTLSELSIIKTVSQWQTLTGNELDLSENGCNRVYMCGFTVGSERNPRILHTVKVPELGEAFQGAMYRETDTVFLLNESQIYDIWKNFGIVGAKRTDSSIPNSTDNNEYYGYWLRSVGSWHAGILGGSASVTSIYGENFYGARLVNMYELGVRPAFYLNEDNMVIKSGSGTENDPYIIDGYGQEGIAVFSQGKQLNLDQQPIEENDRLLVPVRAIFESLGAEVSYDDGDGVITANDGERTVVMQIDNYEMGNGTEVFTLDTAPRIVGERTMVPLRAVSEAFDAKVTYVENLQRVVVDKPEPQVFSEAWRKTPWYKEAWME